MDPQEQAVPCQGVEGQEEGGLSHFQVFLAEGTLVGKGIVPWWLHTVSHAAFPVSWCWSATANHLPGCPYYCAGCLNHAVHEFDMGGGFGGDGLEC